MREFDGSTANLDVADFDGRLGAEQELAIMSSMRNTIVEALVTAYEGMIDDPSTYNLTFHKVYDHAVSATTAHRDDIPLLMVVDTGDDEPSVYDGTNYQYILPVQVRGVVVSDAITTIGDEINRLVSDVRTFVDSDPTIHAQALDYKILGLAGIDLHPTPKGHTTKATVTINTQLRYYCAVRRTNTLFPFSNLRSR